ncbi:Low-density lipoprotein receptor- protein 11 [Saguinus oedipus]|uniref:Low-density lipoprotein receptor- protein 11 n=1 Tax=Saguinus oedipus TaxID=9490 RepID=A0ABQ9VYM4_SAGOE|nr:Low-density lipoprotein receptor- protein 11 [Saguinus oedipus]
MASAARESAESVRRRLPRHRALRGLLLLCLWLPSGRATGPPAAPLSELHAQLSGVEQLLEEFRRQLQQERPQEELELELRAGGGPQEDCPGPGGGGYSALPDAIIRTKDSLAAGASFLRAPAAVRGWRQCVAACCSEPRCSVAVVELPRRPAPPAAALGCYLFNCTAHGRSVCKFALHRGYSSYSLSRAPDGAAPATARASPRQEKDAPPLSKAGQDVVLHLPTDGVVLDGRESTDDHAIIQYEWALLQGNPSVDMKVLQSGTLKLSHLQEGTYTFQLTVTDTAGQKSSDNVSVTVLPMAYSTGEDSGTLYTPCLDGHQDRWRQGIGSSKDGSLVWSWAPSRGLSPWVEDSPGQGLSQLLTLGGKDSGGRHRYPVIPTEIRKGSVLYN